VSFLFPASTITLDAALRDLGSGSPKARVAAAHALGDVTDPTEKRRAVDALVRALDDDRPEVRAEACGSLGGLGELGVVNALLRRLDDGEPAVRQHAAIALGTLRAEPAFDALADALRDGPADLRFQAATSLAEIAGARAFAPLVAALADRDPQVIGAAALALGAIGDPRAKSPLSAVAAHTDAGARFDVAYALAELGDGTGAPALAAATRDPERAWDAVTALARIADAAALDAAVSDKHVPSEAALLAAGSLLALDPVHGAARAALLTGLRSRKGHVRALAVEQLGAHGGAWAKAPLDALARGKGRDLLEPIANALRAIAERERA
jgi:HEAT repeat protein